MLKNTTTNQDTQLKTAVLSGASTSALRLRDTVEGVVLSVDFTIRR